MTGKAAVVAIAVCMSPPLLYAQGAVFTIGSPSAEIHQAPSTGSPVIGTAPRGAALDVTRELGSWVSVSWPGAGNDEAFVHVSRGAIARRAASAGTRAASVPSPGRTAERSAVASDVQGVERAVLADSRDRRSRARSRSALPPVYSTPAHAFGIGGLMGGRSPDGFGASARAWRNGLGVQLNVSRYAIASTLGPDRLTSVQFEPSLLYSPWEHVTDHVWLRPYVGSGVSLRRQTLRTGPSGGIASPSVGAFGIQTFGGGEMTLAGLPQFALSADVGYRWTRTPSPGFDLRGMAFSVSGHWYVR